MRNVQVEKLIDKIREHENRIETLEAQTVELRARLDKELGDGERRKAVEEAARRGFESGDNPNMA